jgi:hypothetical protein
MYGIIFLLSAWCLFYRALYIAEKKSLKIEKSKGEKNEQINLLSDGTEKT